jgi:hypothetical protein
MMVRTLYGSRQPPASAASCASRAAPDWPSTSTTTRRCGRGQSLGSGWARLLLRVRPRQGRGRAAQGSRSSGVGPMTVGRLGLRSRRRNQRSRLRDQSSREASGPRAASAPRPSRPCRQSGPASLASLRVSGPASQLLTLRPSPSQSESTTATRTSLVLRPNRGQGTPKGRVQSTAADKRRPPGPTYGHKITPA